MLLNGEKRRFSVRAILIDGYGRKSGEPHIMLLRCDFGEVATLEITGAESFSMSTDVERAGDSCNYHFNWDPADNQVAGPYVFTVNGDLSFSADSICDTPGNNN